MKAETDTPLSARIVAALAITPILALLYRWEFAAVFGFQRGFLSWWLMSLPLVAFVSLPREKGTVAKLIAFASSLLFAVAVLAQFSAWAGFLQLPLVRLAIALHP